MLTTNERIFLSLFTLHMSNAARCKALGLTLNEAHAIGAAIREKLNLAPGVSLVTAAQQVRA